MKEKIEKAIHNYEDDYLSYESIKSIVFSVFLFMSLIVGTVCVVGQRGDCLFVLITINVLYWVFICLLRTKYIKKTYRLRFLTQGIMSLFMSILFLHTGYCVLLVVDGSNPVKYIAIVYFCIFAIANLLLMILKIKNECSGKLLEYQSAWKIILYAGLFPIIEFIYILTQSLNKNIRVVHFVFCGFFCIAQIFSYGYVNLLKYYYCIKYSINCDVKGKADSPFLDPKFFKSKKKK